ncbi:hypothetical protein CONPUDRAFT_163522 [Coniophora puteana RWD-64-598 SS2]|uniref:DUF2415 domain-containing protein n=1 Tax=Coniophora puteana (strain RWD-64-598) TaxID=741705 RepID=A0A5M3MZF6_CONPW|nr:uncharacterized protein CONPUDRAFT_163522 [Coniophora puteana RWD-64-598 SS2]EIW84377.1 hypothetical protein CONPUDRAFT_163522 [Coniophora puteana RWD-64-598 SS2]
MARSPTLLTSHTPTASAPASVAIDHVQLRDLVVCPREAGVVNYVSRYTISEHDVYSPEATPRTLVDLSFRANTISSLNLPDTDHTLFAAGGQDAEVFLSLHPAQYGASSSSAPSSSSGSRGDDDETAFAVAAAMDDDRASTASTETYTSHGGRRRRQQQRRFQHGPPRWQYDRNLRGSINNSVMLTSLGLSRANSSSVEPRLVVSNNDCSVKFYDVPIRVERPPKDVQAVGSIKLRVAVNHSSISPDGRTLLSVGDSSEVFLHQISGARHVTLTPISTLSVPDASPSASYSSSTPFASFSTAFSADGMKYAVASQEGVVAVWDVRSSKPMKVIHTDKTARAGEGGGWTSEDPTEWTRGYMRAPGWGVRSVKFGSAQGGHEVMTFTEHTNKLHVVDARTFETEEIVRVPSIRRALDGGEGRSKPIPTRRATVPVPRVRPTLYDSPEELAEHASLSRESLSSRMWTSYIHADEDDRGRGDGDEVMDADSYVLSILDQVRNRDEEEHHDNDSEDDEEEQEDDDSSPVLIINRSRSARERDHEHDQGQGEMDVDELEADCLSSHAPSRSSTPPLQGLSPTMLPTASFPSLPSAPMSSPAQQLLRSRQPRRRDALFDFEGPRRVGVGTGVGAGTHHYERMQHQHQHQHQRDVDLAGTCFDPSGAFVYAASTEGVVEWAVRGAGKRWWGSGAWA